MKTLVVFFSIFYLVVGQKYRLCVHSVDSLRYCDELNRANEIQCIKGNDSVDCTNKIKDSQADFTVLAPEQSLLAAEFPFINGNTRVAAEIRAHKKETQPSGFQMVVVVKRDHTGGLEGLRGKKYCHPGFEGHDLWTPRLLKEFEYKLFGGKFRKNCKDNNITFIEHELKVLDEFFGDSCRNGPWTDDEELNQKLTTQYKKLTALCDATKKDSLSCLKVQNADLAYTTLSSALTMPDKDNFRLLCQNGSLAVIRNGLLGDCSWRNQPWTLVIAQKDKVQQLQSDLKTWINFEYHAAPGATPFAGARGARPSWLDTLTIILLQDLEQYRINVLYDQPLLKDYFKRNNQELKIFEQESSECQVKWCTISQDEQDKCTWLDKASVNAGIEPQIDCRPGVNLYDCLRKIKENLADIMAIDSNYGYLARKMGMSNLLYSENPADDIASVIAVIPEQTTIKKFADLKYKRACFPEYRGLAWVSFIDAARRFKLIRNDCIFGKSVSDFFNEICAPGAKDDLHFRENVPSYEKLCSACSDNCESDTSNRYFNNTGVLNCLIDNKADVVFTEWQEIEKEPNLNNYRILCNDDQIMTIDEYKQNWDACSLSNTVNSEVIARHNDTRRADYKHGLLEMDILFGAQFRNDKVFQMFKEYNGQKNLLFKENVLGLASTQSDNKFVQNYIKLFQRVDSCTNDASFVHISTVVLLSSLLFVFSTIKCF